MLATKTFGDDDDVDFWSVIFFMAEFDIRQSRSATCRGTQRSRRPLDKGAGQLCGEIFSRKKKDTFARVDFRLLGHETAKCCECLHMSWIRDSHVVR
jgi:hypothetical protein